MNWCKVCNSCAPVIKGRCRTCNQYLREHGVERPESLYSKQPDLNRKRWERRVVDLERQELCSVCNQVAISLKGRCRTCYQYFRRHGVERPERLYRRQADFNALRKARTPMSLSKCLECRAMGETCRKCAAHLP